ncbi:MAG TPA: competence/damage-inducible protein A [Candidatus Polarisedimenticolia bacterium]|nr:competence/damage-inducible protein A [Candidatus Polarisedimenticolia bacterium]
MSPPRAELLAIGSELLEPWHVDTNGAYLSRRLGERAIAVRFRTVVGDTPDDLKEAFRVAVGRSDWVVATGGLGPTIDDLTRETVAELLDLPLLPDEGIAREIEARFRRLSLPMPTQNRRQAMVPRGARVLANRLGTAPGLWLETGRSTIVLLPGVPEEMRQIFEDSVLPRLPATGERFAYRVIKIAGLPESEVDRRLDGVARGAGPVAWTILASPGQVEIHLRERLVGDEAPAGIERLDADIAATLGPHVFARDEESMEEVIGRLLVQRSETLATAESLTGGAIARRITSVPGASRYFRGGVVAYSDEAKRSLLGVRPETLETLGAVSAEAAAEMARGARRAVQTTWALSSTGFAGPEGPGPGRPPGQVFLGLSGPGIETTRDLTFPGSRATVRERTARSAIDLLRRALLEAAP